MNIKLLNWDDYAEMVCESKGYFAGLEVEIDGARVIFDFFDPIRFNQDFLYDLNSDGFYHSETPLVILPAVNKENIVFFLRKKYGGNQAQSGTAEAPNSVDSKSEALNKDKWFFERSQKDGEWTLKHLVCAASSAKPSAGDRENN